MKSIFIDTWGWINLFNRKEADHEAVKSLYQNARTVDVRMVTTDYILDEVYTLLFKRVPFERAKKAVNTISDAIEMGYISLEWITLQRFEKAQKLRIKLNDKPDISFTDLTSMLVMQELKISEIITGDAHFTHVGMGFVLLPE